MKMAKASEADLKMALELTSMLEGFERGHFPPVDDGEAEDFCIDLGSHCQSAMDKILEKLTEGSLSRVVYGMVVLLNPKNEAIDHSLDYLEHHPKVRMHDELVEASRAAAAVAAEYLEAQRVINAGPPRAEGSFAPPRSWRHTDPEVRRWHAACAALNALAAKVEGR